MSIKKQIGLTGRHNAEQAMDLLLKEVRHIFPNSKIKKGRFAHQPKHGFEDVYISKGNAYETKDKLSIGFTRFGKGGKLWVRVACKVGTDSMNYREFAISDLDVALEYLSAVDDFYLSHPQGKLHTGTE